MDLTQEIVKRALDYNAENGELVWKARQISEWPDSRSTKVFNSQFAGKKAGVISKNGYVLISLLGKRYYAHRLIWLLTNGYLPGNVDHINGCRSDNRLSNLRPAAEHENRHNAGLRKNNTSGFKNVHWSKALGRWSVEIRTPGKRNFIGYYDDINAANKAACAARDRLHGEFSNHGAVE